MEEVVLERFKYAAMNVVPKELILEVDESMSYITGTIAMRVTRMVYGHRLAEWTSEVQVPKNWWQHLLSTVGLPHKTERRYATITSKRLYPDLPVLPQKQAGISVYVEDEVVIG